MSALPHLVAGDQTSVCILIGPPFDVIVGAADDAGERFDRVIT